MKIQMTLEVDHISQHGNVVDVFFRGYDTIVCTIPKDRIIDTILPTQKDK